MSLLTTTSAISNKKLLKINRKLTANDLDLGFSGSFTDARYAVTTANKKLVGTLNKAVSLEILSALNPDVYADGKFCERNSPLCNLMERGGEEPVGRKEYVVLAELPSSMIGIKREAQQARYDAILAEVDALADANYDKALTELVDTMNEALETTINIINQDFKKLLKDLVVDTKVNQNWLEKNLSEDQKAKLDEAAAKEKDIDTQIEALIQQKRQTQQLTYCIKRECITAKLQTALCDDGLKMLDDMQGEEKQETFSDFLLFN